MHVSSIGRRVGAACGALAALCPVVAWADDEAAAGGDESDPAEIIVVTATRRETPISDAPIVTEVLDRAHLEQTGASTVADALAQRAGVWIDRGLGGAGVSLQGLGPKYVLILIDGVRQIGRVDGALDLDRIPLDGVEQIEIVRGPAAAIYGADALGGVINIITRRDGAGIELRTQVDHRGSASAGARLQLRRGARRASLELAGQRGAALDLDPATLGTDVSAYRVGRIAALADTPVRARGEVALDASYQRRDLRGVDALVSGATFDRRNVVELGGARLQGRHDGEALALAGELGLQVLRDQFASDQRGSSALDDYQETWQSTGNALLRASRPLGDHHFASGGLEASLERASAARLSERGRRGRFGAYLQDEWRLGERRPVTLVPAARLDVDTQFGVVATPRLATRWDPHDAVIVRASIGRGYRAPDFKELLLRFENPGVGYVVEGNPDLRPETSWNGQASIELAAGAAAWLGVSGFHNELAELIQPVTAADSVPGMLRFTYGNVTRARTSGLEASARLRRGRAILELGAALHRARDVEGDRALEGTPSRRATIAARWDDTANGVTAVAELTLTGRRPYYLSEATTYAQGRRELRVQVARRFREGLRAYLGGENLLSTGDADLDRLAPATLYAGLEWSR
jgi:outer membrane receptor for ferrienterochelin and colicins